MANALLEEYLRNFGNRLDGMFPEDKAKAVVFAVLDGVTDCEGPGSEWDSLGKGVREEIIAGQCRKAETILKKRLENSENSSVGELPEGLTESVVIAVLGGITDRERLKKEWDLFGKEAQQGVLAGLYGKVSKILG